jgi:hypothetical protein
VRSKATPDARDPATVDSGVGDPHCGSCSDGSVANPRVLIVDFLQLCDLRLSAFLQNDSSATATCETMYNSHTATTGENMNSEHSLDKIKCPNCGDLFPVTEALYHEIEERTREEATQHVVRREKALEVAQARLKEERNTIDRTVAEKTKVALSEIEKRAHTKAHEAVSVELEDWKRQAAEKDRKLDAAHQSELE